MLGVKLDERFGYWYYMTRQERREPVAAIREHVLQDQQSSAAVSNDE